MAPRAMIADDGPSTDGGLIDPAKFPKVDHFKVTDAGTDLYMAGVHFQAYVDDVKNVWSGLSKPGVYESPESKTVFALLDPAATAATDVYNDLYSAQQALDQFATDLQAIEPDLSKLVTEATDFRKLALGPQRIECSKDQATIVEGGPTAFNPHAHKRYYRPCMWWELDYLCEQNRQYFARLADILARINKAEASCTDRINLIGPKSTCTATPTYSGQQFEAAMKAGGTPWGTPPDNPKKSCGESYAQNLIEKPIEGLVTSIGTLAFGYDPRTGLFGQSDVQGAAWSNIGSSLLAVGVTIVFTGVPTMLLEGFGSKDPFTQFVAEQQHKTLAMVAGSFSIDIDAKDPFHKFKEDPGAAWAGVTWGVVNTALLVVGVGEAVSAIRAAAAVSARATAFVAATEALDLVLPGTKLLSSGVLKFTGLGTRLMPELAGLGAGAERAVASAEGIAPRADVIPGPAVGLGDTAAVVKADFRTDGSNVHVQLGGEKGPVEIDIKDGKATAYRETPNGREAVALGDDAARQVVGPDGNPLGYEVKLPDGTSVVIVDRESIPMPSTAEHAGTATPAQAVAEPTANAREGRPAHESRVPSAPDELGAPATAERRSTPHTDPSVPREEATTPHQAEPAHARAGTPEGQQHGTTSEAGGHDGSATHESASTSPHSDGHEPSPTHSSTGLHEPGSNHEVPKSHDLAAAHEPSQSAAHHDGATHDPATPAGDQHTGSTHLDHEPDAAPAPAPDSAHHQIEDPNKPGYDTSGDPLVQDRGDGKLHWANDPDGTFRDVGDRLHDSTGFHKDPYAGDGTIDYSASEGSREKQQLSPDRQAQYDAQLARWTDDKARAVAARELLPEAKATAKELGADPAKLSSTEVEERLSAISMRGGPDGARARGALDVLQESADAELALRRRSENMGDSAAYLRDQELGRTTVLGADPLVNADAPKSTGSGSLDHMSVSKDQSTLYVDENKGGDSPAFGSRQVAGGGRAQQGSFEYLRDLMSGPNQDKRLPALLEQMEASGDFDALFDHLRGDGVQLVYERINARTTGSILTSEFDLGGAVRLRLDDSGKLVLTR